MSYFSVFLCKFVVSAFLYFGVALVMWMLIQGIYLNCKLTTNVLGDENKNIVQLYCFLQWFFPVAVLALYLVVMIAGEHTEMCWRGYPGMIEIWIILAPIVVALSINCQSYWNTFPSSGLNNMLLIYNPGGEFEKCFILLNAFFGSTQDTVVAIVYCFKSRDIQQTVRLSNNRFRVNRGFQTVPGILHC